MPAGSAGACFLQKSMEFSLDVEGVTEVPSEGAELMPWGWSPALLHRMEGRVKPKVDIAAVRALSSRQTAVELLPLLQMEGTMGESVWLTSVDEVCAFAGQYEKVLLKAPWSGSGKGIQPVCGMPDDNLKGWTRRIIASQGGVVGEPFYNKVKDFAFEFKVSDEGVEPVGYSLFEADAKGIYKENRLASDEVIEAELSVYVPKENLQKLWMRLQTELQLLLGEAYRGYLGVDMMIVRSDEEKYLVHPCVEVNLRMNMGVVSRLLFDRFMVPEAVGRYVIEFFPQRGEALKAHEKLMSQHTLVIEGGRVRVGYLPLVPVFEDTNYLIYVII